MQTLKVNSNIFVSQSLYLKHNKTEDKTLSPSISNCQNPDSFYGRDLISFGMLKSIPITEISSRTIIDRNYINSMAKAIGAPVESLKSIIGIDEFKSLMQKASKENFNPKSDLYMINTHCHTLWSDGKASVKEILDEAQQRGLKEGKNFLIGITDHDCFSSTEEAIRLISASPEKYDKIRFMSGIEPCFRYENPEIFKKPIPFDAIGYCINPFDKLTRNLFETATKSNIGYTKTAFQNANKRWGINATFEDACGFHPLIKTGGSTGFLKYSKKYVEKLLKDSGIEFNPDEVLGFFSPYYSSQTGRATIATTKIGDAIKIIKQSGFGEIGIAHPGIVEINPQVERIFDFTSRVNLQDGVEYNDALKIFLNTCGLKIIEGHYQYPETMFKEYPTFGEIIKVVNSAIKKLKMTETGGTDSHGNTQGKILESRY
jgi:histidinol phosphatase-like PHP family hydrolase